MSIIVQPRPTHKELTKKLRRGRELLASPADGYLPVDPLKLGEDFASLNLFSREEQLEGLLAAFAEVDASCYSGHRPPVRSFESSVKDEEVLVFRWQSAFFRRKMYLKFCFHESHQFEEESLYIFSLHEDQPKRRVARKRK